jgi:CubicO group peptidase (beta-lactamase class C family)
MKLIDPNSRAQRTKHFVRTLARHGCAALAFGIVFVAALTACRPDDPDANTSDAKGSSTRPTSGTGDWTPDVAKPDAMHPNGDADTGVRHLREDQIASIRNAAQSQLHEPGSATGYSVAVWRDGAVIYAEAFGVKNEAGDPVNPSTLFEIGSDAKKITVIALLQQVDSGKLTLQQTLSELLPELRLASNPKHFDTLTLSDLLCHRSGLFDYTPWTNAPADSVLADWILGRFAEHEYALMPAGIAHNYSNPDYAIAGYLLQQLTGLAWADAITRTVLAPLKMQHTYARLSDMLDAESDIASGYGLVGGERFGTFSSPLALHVEDDPQLAWFAPADQPDNAFLRPAGMVWSTATDQARLLGFVRDGDEHVLSDRLRREMQVVHAPAYNHVGFGHGYGLIMTPGFIGADDSFYAVPVVSHGGAALSMSSASMLLPDQGVAVSVLGNGWTASVDMIATVALEVAAEGRLPAPSEFPTAIPPPSDNLLSYAGTFHDPNLGALSIRWSEEQLLLDVPGMADLGFTQTTTTLEPYGLDLFVFTIDDTDFDLSFYDGPDGTAHQYAVNRDFVFTRD